MHKLREDQQERWIITAARHMPQRPEAREGEWLALLDECPTPEARAKLMRECLWLAATGFLRAFLLQSSRVILILTLLALPGIADQLRADWTAIPALGIVVLMLVPSLQHRAFDAPWYPKINLSPWIWRTSALAWVLLFSSAVFVSKEYTFAGAFAFVMLLMYGWDLDRLKSPQAVRKG